MQSSSKRLAKFSKRYLIWNEVLNAITHGIGILLSIIGLVLLLTKSLETAGKTDTVSYLVYGISLILLYLSSTLYHSFSFTKAKNFLRRLDHSCIFLLIAGTYTPYALLAIGGRTGWLLIALVWAIALFGVIYKTVWFTKLQGISVWIYIAMGWIAIFFMRPLYQGLGFEGILWLVAGGLSFTVGALFYRLKTVRFMHVVWHLFVLAGTACMFISIYFYI